MFSIWDVKVQDVGVPLEDWRVFLNGKEVGVVLASEEAFALLAAIREFDLIVGALDSLKAERVYNTH